MRPSTMRHCRSSLRTGLMLLMFSGALAVQAQVQVQAQTPAQTRPDPLDAASPVPAARYQSAFKPPLLATGTPAESKPLSWREANDNVARIGGWRVYAQEVQAQEAQAQEAKAGEAKQPDAGTTGSGKP